MGRTVNLQLPEALYTALMEKAQERRSTPEQLILDSLAAAFVNGGRPDEDPLLQLVGCIETGITDIAEKHHDYIGQALLVELRNGNEP